MFGGGYIVGHIRGYWQAVAEITSKIPPRSDGDE